MFFDHIGIYGWEEIEPLILSAALSDLSVLLIGDIGSSKTEGARIISEALLGPDIEFRSYEVPTLNFDDLVGFVNPKHLAKGSLQFVPTPLSIWNADAALFDEINRANPFIQSKLHELIRNRTLMGLPTSLRMVFSAVNPPERYQSGYMDIALASRFVSVQVPNIGQMKDSQIGLILSPNGKKTAALNLKTVIARARRCQTGHEEKGKIDSMCMKIVRELTGKEILFNARQLKMMSRLLNAGIALRQATGIEIFSSTDTNTAYIASVIPEIHGVVRSNANKGMITAAIRTVVSGFTLGDSIITARSLGELCDAEVTDSLAWVSAVKQMAEDEEDVEALKRAMSRTRELARKGVIEHELASKLAHQLATQITTSSLTRRGVPITELDRLVGEIIKGM